MGKFPMCRICLVQNVRMFAVFNRNLRELYETLTEIPLVTKDRRPMLACFFCYAKLKQCYRFQRQCLEAEELFAQMMKEDYEPNPLKQDLTEFYTGFISSPIVHINLGEDSKKESLTIKEETPAVEELDHVIGLKEEHRTEGQKLENSDNKCLEVDTPLDHSESNSEDHLLNLICNVPLIEFQTDVEEEQEVHKAEPKPRTRKKQLKLENSNNSCLGEVDIPPYHYESVLAETDVEEEQEVHKKEPKPRARKKKLKLENANNNCLGEVDIPPYHSESDSTETDVGEEQEVHKIDPKPRARKKNPLKIQANIDVEMRANIIALRKRGLNISEISREMGVCRSTVSRWVTRHEAGDSLSSRKRSGRPPIIREAQLRYIVNEYESNGFIPTKSFAEVFQTTPGTIRRVLSAKGLGFRKPTQRPYLTEKHKQARLNFAREYLDFNWDKTIFSDEKAIKSSRNGKLRLWRRNDTHPCEKKVVPDTESALITVNMWGWMSAAGPGELEYVPPSANSSTYVEVLRDVMLPTVLNVYPADECKEISFVQNNCPVQRASTVLEWFKEHPEIKLIPWPSRSHDLNPMENLYNLMIQRWEERNEKSEEQLKSHCKEIWENIRGTDICSNIVGSMRQRLLDCIANKGDLINKTPLNFFDYNNINNHIHNNP